MNRINFHLFSFSYAECDHIIYFAYSFASDEPTIQAFSNTLHTLFMEHSIENSSQTYLIHEEI